MKKGNGVTTVQKKKLGYLTQSTFTTTRYTSPNKSNAKFEPKCYQKLKIY